MFDLVISGGRVVDGTGQPWYRADVATRQGRIAAVGRLGRAEARERIDAAGRVVCPGFIDAHVHGDLMLLADPQHEPAIRQGVTTYVIGQDGSSMAPASPATLDFMRRYAAGFNGNPPLPETPPWSTVAEFLSRFDRRVAVNVAYLIPNGNVRMEAMGLETGPAAASELAHMKRLVREGMEQGAIGLSSGLDYLPSRYADTAELAALCEEIAPFGGVYVTHMRRYDPEGLEGAMAEVFEIGEKAGVAVHISHFNCQAERGLHWLDAARARGVDATFDLYCYLAGSTILGMIALPPWVQEGGVDATIARLRQRETRARLAGWFARPERGPLEDVRLAHVASAEYQHLEGMPLEQAARETGLDLGEFVCEVLVASELAVGCIAPHRRRGEEDVRALMRHPAMMAGSDGIFIGSRPHPRGWGCFARYLGHHVREAHTWTLEEAVSRLSYHAARRFQLHDRGLIRPGLAADLVVFDPAAIRDRASYEHGRQTAQGVDLVLVNGDIVLRDGKRTAALPGRALRPRRFMEP